MKPCFRALLACFIAAAGAGFLSAGGPESGEEAVAARYAALADTIFRENRLLEAEAVLLRAADYAAVSSDISYLLALVRKALAKPARETLSAARFALAADRWTIYTRRDALYVEAETLIRLRRYNEALAVLSDMAGNERAAELRVAALEFLPGGGAEFEAAMREALERYPYNPAFPRILFRRARRRAAPRPEERALVDTALKRLPALLNVDGSLIRYAAPFIADMEEARRLLAAWRETGGAPYAERAAALPVCLETGLINEETAIDELSPPGGLPDGVDRGVLLAVWDLLRTDEARAALRARMSAFSGLITGDEDEDGVIDSEGRYRAGALVSYTADIDQDGVNEIVVVFGSTDTLGALWPLSAELVYSGGDETEWKAAIVWEKYPALSEAAVGKNRFFFRPMEFNYPVLSFYTPEAGVMLCDPDRRRAPLTEWLMLRYAYRIERPGRDFAGSMERLECKNGVIFSAKEYLDGREVSETVYENGIPAFQRIDLDLDGRMETTRRFRRPSDGSGPDGMERVFEIETIESDFDGDGIFEYQETRP